MLIVELVLWLATLMRPTPANPPAKVTFEHDVQPILEKRCQPCHFTGGTMYKQLPFDKAATIDKLGTKLFTRIKKESDQKVIRAYLASRPAAVR